MCPSLTRKAKTKKIGTGGAAAVGVHIDTNPSETCWMTSIQAEPMHSQ